METVMVLLETGRTVEIGLVSDNYFTSGYIPWRKGKVMELTLPDLRGEVDFDFRVRKGDLLEDPISASDTAVSYVGEYKKYADLVMDFDTIEKSDIVVYG